MKVYPFDDFVCLSRRGNWKTLVFTSRAAANNETAHWLWRSGIEDMDWITPLLNRMEPIFTFPDIQTRNQSRPESVRFFEMLIALLEIRRQTVLFGQKAPSWDVHASQWQQRAADWLKRKNASPQGIFLNSINQWMESWEPGRELLKSSTFLAAESKIQGRIDHWMHLLHDPKQRDDAIEFIQELITQPAVKNDGIRPLIRPALRLLTQSRIETGLPYQAANILAPLSDTRKIRPFLRLLRKCSDTHSNLRLQLIYGLGQEKGKRYFREFIDTALSVKNPKNRRSGPEWSEFCWTLGKWKIPESLKKLLDQDPPDKPEDQIYWAWALGELGRTQKSKSGGLDARIPIDLMRLMQNRHNRVFEEAVMAMKKLGLPNFLYALYLPHFNALPVLALKPSRTGLYELSESLFYVMQTRQPAIMAVTGDSGTGKTYFCHVLESGFGPVRPHEILYLMRDNAAHVQIFNRLIGLKKLQTTVTPDIYSMDNLDLHENADEFFRQFIKRHHQKRLIILDGWRDDAYFHQVIQRFYEMGSLDILVKFQAALSTRRLNLEKREGFLEKVRTNLSFIEQIPLEDTPFYRDNRLLIYHLDNSIPSRLTREEMQAIFANRKVRGWIKQIRVGPLENHQVLKRPLKGKADFSVRSLPVNHRPISWLYQSIKTRESRFRRCPPVPSDDFCLSCIGLEDLPISAIALYTQGQIAFGSMEGHVGVLSGLNDRLFWTLPLNPSPVMGLAVTHGHVFALHEDGRISAVSFIHNLKTVFDTPSAVTSMQTCAQSCLTTGHADGKICFWDFPRERMETIQPGLAPVQSLASLPDGRIAAAGSGTVGIWNPDRRTWTQYHATGCSQDCLCRLNDNRLAWFASGLSNESTGSLTVMESDSGRWQSIKFKTTDSIRCITPYVNGRLFIGSCSVRSSKNGTLMVLETGPNHWSFNRLRGHTVETLCCLTMGPRLITCGIDSPTLRSIRIWGSKSYVALERSKMSILNEAQERPAYYRSLF
ncbi:MAG TPA: hypothetical protein ENN03_09715 [bacterium]|nr:hypothetical protein [bacterium]